MHRDVQANYEGLVALYGRGLARTAHIEHGNIGRQAARNSNVGAIYVHGAGDIESFAGLPGHVKVRIEIGRDDVVCDGLRVLGSQLQVHRYARLEHACRSGYRHSSRSRSRCEADNAQRAMVAFYRSADIGQIYALRVVAQAAPRNANGSPDLRSRRRAGHGRIDRKLTRHVLAARFQRRIEQSGIQFPGEFQIQRAVHGHGGVSVERELRCTAGGEFDVEQRCIAHELRGSMHIDCRQPERGLVCRAHADSFQFHVAKRCCNGALQLRIALDSAGGQQSRYECVDQFRLELVERRAHVERRRQAAFQLEYRVLRFELECSDRQPIGKGQLRWRRQLNYLAVILCLGAGDAQRMRC